MLGEQLLQMGLHAVFDQPRVHTELVVRIVLDLGDRDAQLFALGVLHHPDVRFAVGAGGFSVSRHGGLIQFSGL